MADAVENLGFVFSAKDLASGVVTKAEENVEGATKAAEAHVTDLAESAEQATEAMGTTTESVTATIEAGFNQTNMILRSLTAALTSTSTEIVNTVGDAADALGGLETGAEAAGRATDGMADAAEGLFGQLNFVRGALGQIIKIGGVGAIFGAGLELGKRALGFIWDTLGEIVGPGIEALQNAFKTALAPVSEAIYKLSVKLAPLLQEALTPIVDIVTELIPKVGDFVSGLTESGGIVSTVFGAIQKLWAGLKDPLTRIMNALTDLAEKVLPVILRVVNMIVETAVVPILTKVADILATVVEKLVPIITAQFERMEPILETVVGVLFKIADTLLDSLLPALMPIIDLWAEMLEDQAPMIEDMVEMIAELVDALLPLLPPLVKITGLLLKMSLGNYIKMFTFFTKVSLELAKALMFLVKPLAEIVGRFADLLALGLEEWMNIMNDAWAGFVDLLKDGWEIIKVVAEAVWDFIGPPIVRAATIYINIWKTIFKVIKGLIAPIFEKIVGIVKDMIGYWEEVGEVVVTVWKKVKDAAWNAVIWIWSSLKGAFNKVKNFFSDIVSNIRSAFGKAMDWIKEKITAVLDYVGLDKAGEMAGKFIDTIKRLVTAPIETIKDLINSTIVDTINRVLRWKVPVLGGTLAKNLGIGYLEYLQEGGIVTEPIATTLVERGTPEMVLPLEKTYIQRFVASVLPLMAPVEVGPTQVETDSELKDLLKQVVGQLAQIANLLKKDERVRAPSLQGGF